MAGNPDAAYSVAGDFNQNAAGPDGISWQVLQLCADQNSVGVHHAIILPQAQSVIPTGFMKSTIIPARKERRPACLND